MKLTEEQKHELQKLRECYANSLDFSGMSDFDNIIFQLLSNDNVEKLMDEVTFHQESVDFQKNEKYYM
jgi:hypothetical protein